jgi:hypothetical protein
MRFERVEAFLICHGDELQANLLRSAPKGHGRSRNRLLSSLVVSSGQTSMPQPAGNTLAMRFLLVAAGALFFAVAPAFALTDFNGHWVLDLRASSSPETVLKRLGASWIERQLGGVVQLQATYKQTPDLLTVTLKGPAFRRTDVMHINNRSETKEESRTGQYTIRTFWAGNGTQLNSVIAFRTKESRDAQLTIVRELADGGKTLTLNGTLKVAGDSHTYTLRRIWRRRATPAAGESVASAAKSVKRNFLLS